MKTELSSKPALGRALLCLLFLVLVSLAYRAGGINWGAGVGTALAVSLWLWSARRGYRKQVQDVGAQLLVDRVGELADEQGPHLSLRRIRVANAGTGTIQQVEVTLAQCSPPPAWFQPVRLQRMHGGPHPFDLPERTEVYIELLALPKGHPEFIVVYDSSLHGGLPNGIAIQPLELTVQVTANAQPSGAFVFEASRTARGELELVAKKRD